MEHTVVKGVTEINLKLSVEELNTLTVALGMTNHGERQGTANNCGLNILDADSAFDLYSALGKIVQSVNE